jgi:hypothetical protein
VMRLSVSSMGHECPSKKDLLVGTRLSTQNALSLPTNPFRRSRQELAHQSLRLDGRSP